MSGSDFAGKAVLVTGAASGLGRASAIAFAEAGAMLAIGDLNANGLEDTRRQIEALGAKVVAMPLDVTDTTACAQFVTDARAKFGRIDVLCNVAGIVAMKPLAQVQQTLWDRIFAVNVRGPFFLMQAALPHLVESEGAVVNVASSSALFGHSYLSAYAASKAALISLTKSLAMEFIHTKVRINAVAPGGMNTAMNELTLPDDIDFTLMSRYTGLRPQSEPEDVADLVLYLASSRATAVHGACFSADRGITAG